MVALRCVFGAAQASRLTQLTRSRLALEPNAGALDRGATRAAGSEVAMACHGAALVFAGGSTSSGAQRLPAAAAAPQVLRLPGRPARCLAYLRRDLVAAAGAPSEGVLLLQRGEDGAWAPLRTLHGLIGPSPLPDSLQMGVCMLAWSACCRGAAHRLVPLAGDKLGSLVVPERNKEDGLIVCYVVAKNMPPAPGYVCFFGRVQSQPSSEHVTTHVILATVCGHACRAIRACGCRRCAVAAGLSGVQCQAGAVLCQARAQGAAACCLQPTWAPPSWYGELVSLTCFCRGDKGKGGAAVLEQPDI